MKKRYGMNRTNEDLQKDIQEYAMANLESSIYWTLTTEELKSLKSNIESNRRLNQDPAIRIARILEIRAQA